MRWPCRAYSLGDKDGKIIGFSRDEFWKGRHAGVCVKFFKRDGEDIVFKANVLWKTEGRFDYADYMRRVWSRISPW